MKKTVLFLILAFVGSMLGAQDMFQQLTDKYAKQDGFSATRITDDMFDLYLREKNIQEDSPVFETLKGLDDITVASLSNFGAEEEMNLEDLHAEILEHYSRAGYMLFKTDSNHRNDISLAGFYFLDVTDNFFIVMILGGYHHNRQFPHSG